MFIAIVQIPVAKRSKEQAIAAAEKSGPTFLAAKGLIRKYYLNGDEGGGGVYLWESREAAEAWYDADEVIGMVDYFDMTGDAPSPALDRWVTGVTAMFHPQIADLINARDEAVDRHRAAHPDCDVFEDRALQVTSEMPIDFLAQVRAIEAALELLPKS